MLRAICAVIGLAALAAPARPDVDAVTFAKAFQAGQADQYKNRQVSGTGVSFHGAVSERIADGSTRTSLVVTLGASAADGSVTQITLWDDFVAAEGARKTIVVALSGPDLPIVPAEPARLTFSGVYDGQVRTVMRPPQAAPGESRPCPGEQARDAASGTSFHCVPLLTGATAKIVSP